MLILTDHPIIARRDTIRADLAEATAEASAARTKRAAERATRAVGDDVSPVDSFNARHAIADLLPRYGYSQLGQSNDWRSPFQSSGSYATQDCGEFWISFSASDGSAGIGAATKAGHRHGDAFDLFCHFEHGGDFNLAVRTFGALHRLTNMPCPSHVPAGMMPTGPRDAAHTAAQGPTPDAPEPRSYDELLAEAKALEPRQIDEMEAIVSECAGLNPMRRDAIFRAIKDATGIPLGTIRDQLSQERDAIPEPDHLDLARMTLVQIGRDNILCTNAFVWRWQSRGVWTEQDDRAIKQAVQSRLDNEPMIDVTASLVNSVTDVLKSDIYRPEHEFNRGNPETVNCLSGEIELHQGRWTLRPHCREHYRTTQIPVEYEPMADAPLFRAFLAQVFRDDPDRDDKVRAVLELMGYSLMSHARHEKFVMLIGPGANGKSVLLAILEGVLGAANVAGVQPANFDNRFQRAHLHQKLANIVTELRQGEVIADAELKAITSGEPGTVEHKFKDPFVMRPFATCWFGTNHMPHTRDFSDALFRRAVILQFNRTFAPNEQDPMLKSKLLTELPGILNLTLNAYARALVGGFTQPVSSEAAKTEWRLEADQVAQFVNDACHRVPESRTSAGDVFRAYQTWAQDNGILKTVSAKGLRDRLTRLGFGADRDMAARYVTGLRVSTWAGL